jgi:hypothetical protein
VTAAGLSSLHFPAASPELESFGLKFTPGGAHISRTMMLQELASVLEFVPPASDAAAYRAAVLQQNVLGKATESTRNKSLRHLRELYALDDETPIFGLLRKLYAIDSSSLPQLAIQVAWARDPLLRATTTPVFEAAEGDRVETVALADALESDMPQQYSDLNRNKIARNAASSWTQSGHLTGRTMKTRQRLVPTPAAVTMALFIGDMAGYQGGASFENPWCRLLDMSPDRARSEAMESHRAGMINLRAIGDVVEIGYPLFSEFRGGAR